jgi:hypothetical protein
LVSKKLNTDTAITGYEDNVRPTKTTTVMGLGLAREAMIEKASEVMNHKKRNKPTGLRNHKLGHRTLSPREVMEAMDRRRRPRIATRVVVLTWKGGFDKRGLVMKGGVK